MTAVVTFFLCAFIGTVLIVGLSAVALSSKISEIESLSFPDDDGDWLGG